jgi:CheY-like chemotaxis protein
MRQVLTNLVLNACDAMQGGGTLSLRTYPVGNWVCTQIADTGLGMNEETRRRCLEPFFTTKGQAGTGLGLAIVFGIIERHKGRMELESTEGSGTTVTIWLPKAEIGVKPARDQSPIESKGGRPMRVLLVDDEDLLLEVVSQHLSNMGHTVDCFTDPNEALEEFYKTPHDIVITDRAMPGMTGDNLAKLVREFEPETPIVLLTGFADVISQTGEHLENIDDVLPKPLSQRVLSDVMAKHGGLCATSAKSA